MRGRKPGFCPEDALRRRNQKKPGFLVLMRRSETGFLRQKTHHSRRNPEKTRFLGFSEIATDALTIRNRVFARICITTPRNPKKPGF